MLNLITRVIGSNYSSRHFCGPLLVLLLFLSSTLQREWQAFHDRSGMEGAGGDVAVYYVAGKVVLGNADRHLYYYPSGPLFQGELSRRLVWYAPRDSPWQKVAHESGLNDVMSYTYPPFFALLFAPFALLKLHTAFFLWRELSLALVILSILMALRIANVRPFLPVFSFCVVGALSFFPVVEMLYLAQVGSLILFLWTLGAYSLAKNRPISSGLLFAIGTLIKLTPAVVVPIFLVKRHWRWLAGYATGLVIFTAISVGLLGWGNHLTYFRNVLPLLSCGAIKLENKSVNAFVLQLLLGNSFFEANSAVDASLWHTACWIAKVANFGILLGVLLWNWQRRLSLVDEVVVFALVSLLISPISWRHHYVLAVLPLVVLWSRYSMTDIVRKWESFLLLLATLALGALPLGDVLVPSISSSVVRISLASQVLVGAVIILWLYLKLTEQVWPNGKPVFAASNVPSGR
jgi:alpha-1,2-mannosyltransferase